MDNQSYLDEFIAECAAETPDGTDEKSIPIGWEETISMLVGFGLRSLLPELKEWVKLGATAIALKRRDIADRLRRYAKEKELDYEKVEKAAGVIADKINGKNIGKLIPVLEGSDVG